MSKTIEEIVQHIQEHRCYTHPIFSHWANTNPSPEVVGALFHQIQHFCSSTRPGRNLPQALQEHDLGESSGLLQEIVESEENHGPELATMAGYILNRSAGRAVCEDLYNQENVEGTLKRYSDELLGHLPGYTPEDGLTTQARRAIAVFKRRELTDRESTYRNLGTALALEMISNRHLIPGEKECLVDSGLYGATFDDAEMHYLLEHWGESGAEEQHERNAMAALAGVLNDATFPLMMEGADEFLDSLANLWDVLDAALLESGENPRERVLAGAK